MAQLVKNLPAVRETWVQSLGSEDRLEKRKATHSSILAWRIPWTVETMASQSRARLSNFHFSILGFDLPICAGKAMSSIEYPHRLDFKTL